LFQASGLSLFKPTETQFFIDVITTTLRDRQAKGGSSRNDLIDMMLKAMKDEIGETDSDEIKEQFDLDSELKNHQKTKRKELDEITIVATAMLMLIAGLILNLITKKNCNL
jgi:cytochrome P450